ncbi:MAG: carnitine dehydratase [Flavobacteriales bacterium]|nr:MAG: carnitine dehydratase [Flavobacteriales bacterium]
MLSNLKVIELASVLAGPDVGMFFSELGAEVIKIENKLLNGDVTRKWKSANEDKNTNVSAYFSSVNWNKKHLFLNLTDKVDKQKVYNLIASADIVITNFKPGDDTKLGMDYSTLKNHNSSLIYGVINGYGSNSKRVAYDVILQAETGFMSMNGTLESGPIKMPVALIDVLAAHQLKEGLLLALLNREKTKKGAFVEVSLYDTALASLKNQATNWLMNNFIPQPIGSLHPNIAPYGETFKTKDGKLLILAIGTDHHFKMLLGVIGAEKLLENKNYANNQLRVTHRKKLATDLNPFFNQKTKEELMVPFLELNIPVGVINNLEEVFENKKTQDLILEEIIENVTTKRIKTAVFKISN